jgi:beta-galactosidase
MRPGRQYRIGEAHHGLRWRDLIELDADAEARMPDRYEDGWPARVCSGRWHAHAGCVDEALLLQWLLEAAHEAGLTLPTPTPLPEGLRLRRRGDWQFAINHGPDMAAVPAPANTPLLLGSPELPPGGVALWRSPV